MRAGLCGAGPIAVLVIRLPTPLPRASRDAPTRVRQVRCHQRSLQTARCYHVPGAAKKSFYSLFHYRQQQNFFLRGNLPDPHPFKIFADKQPQRRIQDTLAGW